MKIVIGVCGFGNGHVYRQKKVIEYLLKGNHDLIIATTEKCKAT